MKNTEIIPLLRPTDATAEGLRLHIESGRLVLDYDYNHRDGTIRWTRLVFSEALAVEYRQNVCCDAERIQRPHEMERSAKSTWLGQMIRLWTEELGGDEWQKELGGA